MESLARNEDYRKRGVRALVIDVLEPEPTARAWAERAGFGIPVLLDTDGKAAASYAPADVLPELPRSQVPIAANLIIDREGRIRFYELLDSRNFDSKLIRLKARLDALLEDEEGAGAAADVSVRAAAGAESSVVPAIVTVQAPAGLSVAPGQTLRLELEVRIAPDYHVMANPATEDYFIPLELEIDSSDDLRAGPVIYPEGIPFGVEGFDDPISTYERAILVTVPVTAAEGAAPGPRTLRGELRYQGCSRHSCLVPAALAVEVEVTIEEGR